MEQPPENQMSETFDNFGDGMQNEETTAVPVEITNEVKESTVQDEVLQDYESMTLEDIVKLHKFEVLTKESTIPNFSQVLVHNKYHKFYLGKNETLGPCSLIILNGTNTKKVIFANLLSKLSLVNETGVKGSLKLKGVVVLDTSCYLLFEPILSSYRNKLKEKSSMDINFKFATLFYVIELLSVCHDKSISLGEIRPSNLLYSNLDELRYLIPFSEFSEFNMNHENKTEKVEEEFRFNRYKCPEEAIEDSKDIIKDVWTIGCIFIELLSTSEVWLNTAEDDMLNNLRKYYVPKIPKDIPKHAWGIICECLNPFRETRILAKELLERYVRLMIKLKIPELAKDIEKYASDLEVSRLNNTVIDGEDPMAIRKCPLHPKNEAFIFCAQCCEIICEQCKKTIHIDHADKGVFFEYMDFVNLGRSRIHSYKEKFNKYIVDANVPNREIYDVLLKTNEDQIEQLYINQKAKIEEQFSYLATILEQLKQIEIDHLSTNKDFFKTLFGKILENYTAMQTDIDDVHRILDEKEALFLKFQDLEQLKKEECMKNIPKDENMLNFKKKNIIKFVANFHRESSQIERLKRYFEMFIDKYKENKINDLVRVVEKKNESIKKKYADTDLNEYLKILIYEFEQISLISSRNYFNSTSRELFISIVNTNKIFSYNLDAQKYFVTEVDFKSMPINRFPNYSRSLVINGNLLVNGGYDEENKVTLPYFFFYDRLNKTLTRLNDMLFGHSAHSIIYIPMHYVVVVSGSGILKCEKYDMESNQWTELPDINIPRQNCTLYYYNKQYLYTFGGAYWDDTKKSFIYVETIERLDMGFGSVEGATQWEQIQTYKLGKELNLRKSVMTVLSYTANKILLVGGSISYNTYSDESILFDFEKNEFSLKEGVILPKKTCFPNKTFLYSNDKAFQLDNDGNVFEFDFLNDKFNIVKENTILKSTKTG